MSAPLIVTMASPRAVRDLVGGGGLENVSIFTGWLVLFGFGCTVLVLIGVAAWLDRRSYRRREAAASVAASRRPPRVDPAQLQHVMNELNRRAAVAVDAAQRARAAAAAARARCAEIEQARDRAWHEWDTAQHLYVTALRTAPVSTVPAPDTFPVPVPRPAPANISLPADGPVPANGAVPVAGTSVARPLVIVGRAPVVPDAHGSDPDPDGHDVARAALAAYRRGELSVEELHAVYGRAVVGHLDPEQHAREVAVSRARQREWRRRYDAAAAAERSAYRAADVADAAARAWAAEAAAAVEEVRTVRAAVDQLMGPTAHRRRRSHNAVR